METLTTDQFEELRREALAFIYEHPGLADQAGWWNRYSARQIVIASFRRLDPSAQNLLTMTAERLAAG